MTPEFDAWFEELQKQQQDRESGIGGDLWARAHALATKLDRLAIGNLHARGLAAALLAIERACIRYEERDYEGSLREIDSANLTVTISDEIACIVAGARDLVEGNVYLVQERFDDAIRLFESAKATSGDRAGKIRADASFNLGVILLIREQFDVAQAEFKRASSEYESAHLFNKVADCLHQLGLIFRQKDETLSEALSHFMAALNHYIKRDDVPGQWRVCDDLARLWLIWSGCAEDIADQRKCEREAMTASIGAAMAASRLWRTRNTSEGRFADLSEQLLNHTMTHCEVCVINDNMPHLLGALAVSKGRIRSVAETIPQGALVDEASDLIEALRNDDPRATLALIQKAIPRLNRRGERIAVVDQLGLRGDRLLSGILVPGDDPCWEAITSHFHSSNSAPVRRSLRGRDRCRDVEVVVARLMEAIHSHSNRCAYLLGCGDEPTDQHDRNQLAQWASELNEDLRALGRWFFPDDLLTVLRELKVTHVVLVSDPAFAMVPYAALETSHGCVIDQPWSLTQITSAPELLRLAYRLNHEASERPILWMGPDEDVNVNRGGNAELAILSKILPVEESRGQDATLARACSALAEGRWVHFRGHGKWNDDVTRSGPIFANKEILDRAALESIGRKSAGFLATTACHTGFSTAVGSEAFGSLVDYDRAGLRGALLTRWPILGSAATPFMRRFYTSLITTGHAGRALQEAARQTRDASPHPYLWAPFVALGAWETSLQGRRVHHIQQ